MKLIDTLTCPVESAPVDVDAPTEYLQASQNNNFSLFFANINSVRKNFNELMALLNMINHQFSIIALNESKLSQGEHLAYPIQGYHAYSQPRDCRGGGVLIYVRDLYEVELIDELCLTSSTFESLFIKLKNASDVVTVGSIYRPPNSQMIQFNSDLKSHILDKLPDNNTLIAGDFNINLLAETTPSAINFTGLLYNKSLFNVITQPTRVTQTSATLIDHIWCSSQHIDSSHVIEYSLSDHFPVSCFLNFPNDKDFKWITSRPFHDNLKRRFIDHFTSYCETVKTPDADYLDEFEHFYIELESMITDQFPIKTKKCRNSSLKNPWIDSELKSLITKKHLIYKKMRRGLVNSMSYKNYRNMLNTTLKLAKKVFLYERFANLSSDKKAMWSQINKTLKPCKEKRKIEVKINNVNINSPQIVKDIVNSNFLESRNIVNDNFIAECDFDPSRYLNQQCNSFFFKPTDAKEISDIIKTMKNNSLKSSLPTKCLKLIAEPLAKILANFFNKFIENGTFPNILKRNFITPIPKKGNSKSLDNLRPITILCPIAKIFDSLMYNRVDSFTSKYNIISPLQFGFQKNKSIEQASLNLMYNINKANTDKSHFAAVFIDLTKAFDTINHNFLLSKLSHYGFRSNSLFLFANYIKNRLQYTVIEKHISSPLIANCGVAQGSSMGPLLFDIYVNDVVNCLEYCSILIYADDIVLFFSSKSVNDLETHINADLLNLNNWFNFNHLHINLNKTFYLYIPMSKIITEPLFKIGSHVVKRTKEFKYLGLIIDDKLTFRSHILHVTRKVNYINSIINSLKIFLPIFILKKIYYALVQPHINLHINVWGGSTASALNPLRVALNRIIRNMCRMPISTCDKYKHLNILPLTQLYYLRISELFYKTLVLNQSQLLYDIIGEITFNHTYRTRHHDNFRLPRIRTEVNRHFFLTNCIKIWQQLPSEVKDATSLYQFKCKFKYLYFSGTLTLELSRIS